MHFVVCFHGRGRWASNPAHRTVARRLRIYGDAVSLAYMAVGLDEGFTDSHNLLKEVASRRFDYHAREPPDNSLVGQYGYQQWTTANAADVIAFGRQAAATEVDHLLALKSARNLSISDACDRRHGEVRDRCKHMPRRRNPAALGREARKECEISLMRLQRCPIGCIRGNYWFANLGQQIGTNGEGHDIEIIVAGDQVCIWIE